MGLKSAPTRNIYFMEYSQGVRALSIHSMRVVIYFMSLIISLSYFLSLSLSLSISFQPTGAIQN